MNEGHLPGDAGARRRLCTAVAAALLVMSGCGGGEQQAGVSSGGTGTFSNGPVTQMGSIVVTGVHFDQRTAKSVVDAEGKPLRWQDIDVGMNVEVDAGIVVLRNGREEATSAAIRVTSDLLGPVVAVDAGTDTIDVMGQKVRVNDRTVLRKYVGLATESMTLAELHADDIVEVYGFEDAATKDFIATRIERKDTVATSVNRYVMRGIVRDLTTEGCRIGTQRVYYRWQTDADVVEGRVARAVIHPAQYMPPSSANPDGMLWVADRMQLSTPLVANRTHARLDGLITQRSSDMSFSINGVTVDSALPCTNCLVGAKVQVTGELVRSVLKADKVMVVPATP